MKHFIFLIWMVFAVACANGEVLHVYLENMNGGVACVRDTISADVDTIQIIPYSETQEYFCPYVVLESLDGATDSFFCQGDPAPAQFINIALWDSNATSIIGNDTIQGAFSGNVTVNFDTIPAGSLPIPISFRGADGLSDYPLDWVDGARHYPYLLISESSSDSTINEWHPPYSIVWNFYVHVGTGADRAILTFCISYARK
jgi:hypothetical protein